MKSSSIQIGGRRLGRGRPFFIAGPCVIESEKHCLKMAERLAGIAARVNVDFIFKASYDKANRSSPRSFRGPGLEEGLRILEKAREVSGLPLLSDVHETSQVRTAAEVLDVLQIPAFLSRQTDLIRAAAAVVDGFFFEVHDNPERALSDGPNALNLKLFPRLLDELLRIRASLGKPQ